LYLKPTLTSDTIGVQNVLNGYTMDMWGSSPADLCTGIQLVIINGKEMHFMDAKELAGLVETL
jgi:hypothetical protein